MDGAKEVAKLVVVAGVISLWTGVGPTSLLRGTGWFGAPESSAPAAAAVSVPATAASASGTGWFEEAKPFCNAVEVATYLRAHPFPADFEGSAHGAACLALAGRIEDAGKVLQELPADDRWRAAGVVFNVGHPAADAGDDVASGPLMELVVDFWPNHYMALYHAGASRYQRGDHARARGYLQRFLDNYDEDDGWSRSAHSMLENMARGAA